MTYEGFKSIILAVLVVLSTSLTWGIWTFQPNYDKMEDEETVQEVSLSEQKDVKRIVKPDRIYYHQKENRHLGTIESSEIDKVIKEISQWNFDRFEDVSKELGDIPDFLHKSGNAEIVFQDLIPMGIYNSVLKIKDKDALSIQFDRIIIDTKNVSKESGYVYFISADRNLAYRSTVTASFVTNFAEDYYLAAAKNKNFLEYSLQTITKDHGLFVPTKETKMLSYNYLADPLPIEKFRDALFSDPRFVQRNYKSSGEEYFDESTLLSVNYDTNTILYVNPAQGNGGSISSDELLQQSIDFVNGHGGWTGNYQYVGLDQLEKTVLFRLYDISGFPIFSNSGMSEILEIWGETEINQYMRNNFSLGRRVESTEVTMKSGLDVLEQLKKSEDINPEFIQEIVLGYEMSNNSEGTLIHLEPAWYYKYKDQWWQVPSGGEGGMDYGVE
jgi:regulatory protein YycH of two-component signal transduction system YycFG